MNDEQRTNANEGCLLAVDPGSSKCGLAIVDRKGHVKVRAVVNTGELTQSVFDALGRHTITEVLLGNGTCSKSVQERLLPLLGELRLHLVDEASSTLKARERYFRDHPPRGWRRLIPLSMQVPREPHDDYVAVLLAERFLESQRHEE